MVERQQVFPWQNIGMCGDAAPAVPAKQPIARPREENQKKRHRSSIGTHPAPPKRQQTSASNAPADNRKRPVEFINLVDDEDDLPSSRTISNKPPLPYVQQPSYNPQPLYVQQQVHYPSLPDVGTQNNSLGFDKQPIPANCTPLVPTGITSRSDLKELVPFQDNVSPAHFKQAVVPRDSPAADVVPILEPTLCKEQADLVHLILSGQNVFYTGSAGCGKSTVLKAFVKRFAELGKKVDIVAPTGRAALDINGSTTWTYAGWTPDHHKKPLKELRAAAHGKFVHKRLNETNVLVIDEISMVENHHFERINALMKEARNDESAFGGVQIVVTGDFCQLPPVKPFRHCIECGNETIRNRDETEYRCRAHGTFHDIDKWAFRSKAWKECDFAHVNLTQIHRQSDRAFIDILNNLRMGVRLLPTQTDLLLNHKSETRNAIQLFATRAEVNRVNEERFKALRSIERTYQCLDHFHWNQQHGNLRTKGEFKAADGSLQSLAEHRFESRIRLKKGMLVVLLHNLDISAGLVNGSQGTIQGFEEYDPEKMPKAATSRDKRDGLSMPGPLKPGVPVLQGDHALFRERQLREYVSKMEFKAWPIVR